MGSSSSSLRSSRSNTRLEPIQNTLRMGNQNKADQDFQQLRSECLKAGYLFCDPTFPASPASLGNKDLGPNSPTTKGVVWKRPSELCPDPQFIVGRAARSDICQGIMGDCWLIAGMACLTMDPQIMKRVVPPDQSFKSQYAGIFHFQLWQFGKWVDVVVDDRLPTRDGKLLFDHSARKDIFWSALLEKAYAKVNGSYESLIGGLTSESFEDFTGGLSESYDLKKSPSSLFIIMKQALKLDSLLGCSIESQNKYDTKTPEHLVKSHAYSITAAQQVHYKGSTVELLRIRNPWGYEAWTGAWSNNSKEWSYVQPEEKKKLSYSADDGEFWMSCKDFKQQFSRLDICHLTPSMLSINQAKRWFYAEFEGEWKASSTTRETFCSSHQFFVCLEDMDDEPHDGVPGCTVLIGLMQKVSRKEKKNLMPIGFTVYKVPNEVKGRSNVHLRQDNVHLHQHTLRKHKATAQSKASRKREVCERLKLPPADYIIIPTTVGRGHEGSFLLRVLTEKKAHISKGPK